MASYAEQFRQALAKLIVAGTAVATASAASAQTTPEGASAACLD